MKTIARNEIVTGNRVETVYDVLNLSEFVFDDSYLEMMHNNKDLCNILEKHGVKISETEYRHGGFGIVCPCENGTVVKIASSRISGIQEIFSAQEYVDIKDDFDTPEQMQQKSILTEILNREAYIYDVLDAEEKKKLTPPFVIAVCVDGKICDYLNCINMPCYAAINEIMQEFNEKEVLKMIADVLGSLQKAHTKGIRHRDIKPENIMYSKELDKYMLLDWGSSCRLIDNKVEKALYGINNIHAMTYTKYYVDPNRILNASDDGQDSASVAPNTDLYSLGVIMVYFAHEKGYFAGNSISEFHQAVCSDAKIGTQEVIDSELCNTLKAASEEYRRIAGKAMNHTEGGYEYAGNMLNDVKNILGSEKNEIKPAAKKKVDKRIKIPVLWGDLAVVAFLVLYTLIFSGVDGIKTVTFGSGSIIVYLLSAFLNCVIILCGIIFNNRQQWYVSVNLKTVIYGAALFLTLSLTTIYFLKDLNEFITLDTNCIQYLFVVLTMFVISKARKLFADILCGGLYGLCVGLCVAGRISEGSFENLMSNGFANLVLLLVICGVICSLVIYLARYKIYVISEKRN